jgi:hydrogenase 3 maturation protease
MKKVMPSSPAAWKSRIRKEIRAARRIIILGVGNISKGDDAAGILCAQELKILTGGKARSRPKILLGYENPENTTGEIRKFRPDFVLILDAAHEGHEPGTVFIVGKNQIEDDSVSTHTISLTLLVSYLEETIGCKVMVLGIQPLNLGSGENVSLPVKKSAERLAAYIAHVFMGTAAGVKPTRYA